MNIFYNRSEHRLRAFWRLLIQLALLSFSLKLVSLLSALVIFLLLALTGQAALSLIVDLPAFITTINALLGQQALLIALHRLVSILLVIVLFALLARVLDRRSWKDYGLHFNPAWWRDLGFGLLLGALSMAIVFGVELLLGWVQVTGYRYTASPAMDFWPWMLAMLAYYSMVGVNEELFSRGFQLRNLAEGLNLPRIGPRRALLLGYAVTSSIFGLLHMGNANATPVSVANLVVAGLMLGLGRVLTGSLAVPIGLHITWNFFQGIIFGFPVSGSTSGLSLIGIQQAGPDIWTGGQFGPEGGLLCVLVMLLTMALTWAYTGVTRGTVTLDTSLAVYRRGSGHEGADLDIHLPHHVDHANAQERRPEQL